MTLQVNRATGVDNNSKIIIFNLTSAISDFKLTPHVSLLEVNPKTDQIKNKMKENIESTLSNSTPIPGNMIDLFNLDVSFY